MKKTIFISLSLLLSLKLTGQIFIDNRGYVELDDCDRVKSEVIANDIDRDGVLDSMYYDCQKEAIAVKLSSDKFAIRHFPSMSFSDFISIDAEDGVLYIRESWMRYSEYRSYCFDNHRKDYRLMNYTNEYFGNATNDGSGTCSLDLLSGEFSADWNYYDYEQDSLIAIPTIEILLPCLPAYLSDSTTLDLPLDSIYNFYKEKQIIKLSTHPHKFD